MTEAIQLVCLYQQKQITFTQPIKCTWIELMTLVSVWLFWLAEKDSCQTSTNAALQLCKSIKIV